MNFDEASIDPTGQATRLPQEGDVLCVPEMFGQNVSPLHFDVIRYLGSARVYEAVDSDGDLVLLLVNQKDFRFVAVMLADLPPEEDE